MWMKKCDCYNQHDQEIRDVLDDLKAASLHMKEKSKALNRLIDVHQEFVKGYEEPSPLIGILMGVSLAAGIINVISIVMKLAR